MKEMELESASLISVILILCIGGKGRFVWSYEGARGVRLTYSPSLTNFYDGQKIQLTCEAGTGINTSYETAIPSNKPIIIGLIYRIKNHKKWSIERCHYEYGTGGHGENKHWDPFTDESCGFRDHKLDRFIVTGNITKFKQRNFSNFTCAVLYHDNDGNESYIFSTNMIESFPDFKVAPQNLTLNLSSVVEEGEAFNFSCRSVGAIPNSSYTYKIQRDIDNVLSDPEDTFYVPNAQDRAGINVSCTDEAHINFPGSKSNIIKWKHIRPQYIDFQDSFGKEAVNTVDLATINSPSIELSCDVFVSSSGLARLWFINGVDQIDQKDEVKIALNVSSLKNNDKVDCKVRFNVGQTSKQYSWLFRSYKLPWLPLILETVAFVGMITLVFVILPAAYKKRATQNAVAPKGNPTVRKTILRKRDLPPTALTHVDRSYLSKRRRNPSNV